MYYAGIDIGGTKSAVIIGKVEGENITVVDKERFSTQAHEPNIMLEKYKTVLKGLLEKLGIEIAGIGISCGGPLDHKRGIIMSPPNLMAWDNIAITDYLTEAFNVPVSLQNDANACAVAEWKFGAGKGTDNMAFLTFGTGIGAGLILNGKLFAGNDCMAGEVGHIRAAANGPTGYGKAGSYEGFCSGAGIAKLCADMVTAELDNGSYPAILRRCGSIQEITAKHVGDMADEGDPLCIEVYRQSGEKLGNLLSVMIDLLNLDCVVIGSIFMRSEHLIRPAMQASINRETLPVSNRRCRILPSGLKETVGDIAAICVAIAG